MKNIPNIAGFIAVVILLASCSSSQNLSSYDDVYYSPSDDIMASVDDEYIDVDERDYSESTQESSTEEYYDPDYRETEYSRDGTTVVNNYYNDDFYYSNRMRRFNSNVYMGFNYYDPFFSYNYWNTYDPYFWAPRPISPFAYRPGWGFGWNNNFGWTASFNYGYGAFGPYSAFGYGGFGYNPWSYYGNAYCPPYGSGFVYNDFYSVGQTVYRGQYNSLGSSTSSTSTALGRGERDKAIQLSENTVKPSNSVTRPSSDVSRPISDVAKPSSNQSVVNTRPEQRPREDGIRPVETSNSYRPQVAGTRPVNSSLNTGSAQSRPASVDRPIQSKPNTSGTRPATTKPSSSGNNDYVRPQQTRPVQEARPIRDNGNYKPSSPKPRNNSRDYTRPSKPSNSSIQNRTVPSSRNTRPAVRSSSPSRSSGSSTRSSSPSKSNSGSRGSRSGGRR